MPAKNILFGFVLAGATLSTAVAIPLTYDVGTGSSVTANSSSDGLAIRTQLAAGLSSQLFTLNDGQSYTFNFFSIWTDETYVDSDDTTPKAITATLDFAIPDVNAQIGGITFSGTYQGTSGGAVLWKDALVWNDSVTVKVGTRVFTVTLNDAVFDLGQNGSLGNSPAMITATVTQLSSTAVPEGGSTAALLGVGFGALVLARRRIAA
jgi:hypothetical protein